MKKIIILFSILFLVSISHSGYKKPPWHFVDIWWQSNKPLPIFKSLSLDFTIHNHVPDNVKLYIAPVGWIEFNDRGAYAGIQTDLMKLVGRRRAKYVGQGLIFSRWKTRDLSATKVAPGGYNQSAGYEGDFVGVRNVFTWSIGKYTIGLKKTHTQVIGGRYYSWVKMTVTEHRTGRVGNCGSIRFYGRNLKLKKSIASFVEIYGGSIPYYRIPRIKITFGNIKVNGTRAYNDYAYSSYPKNVPPYGTSYENNGMVTVELGRRFSRQGLKSTKTSYYKVHFSR